MARRGLKKVTVVNGSYVGPYIPRDMRGQTISIPKDIAEKYITAGIVEPVKRKVTKEE